MTAARYIVGDVRKILVTLPDASVDLILTSPPFFALRSYLPADHPDKRFEIGSEATPGEYIDTLLDVVEACSVVLAPHGSMCFELGDTYSGSGGAGGDYSDDGLRAAQPAFRGSAHAKRGRSGPGRTRAERDAWPLDKSLCLIPEIFRFSLVYGFNPLTGRETPRWRARNVVRWCRPNPPVGALADKFRPATSEMVVICKDRKRYFDLDAVRMALADSPGNRYIRKVSERDATVKGVTANNVITADYDPTAPPLDWWKISTQGYEGSHYATYPEELCVTPVKAMCPLRVCLECGRPSERIVERQNATGVGSQSVGRNREDGHRRAVLSTDAPHFSARLTLGWTDCGCCHVTAGREPSAGGNLYDYCSGDHWRNGVILDPFAGSGTTLAVATGHGRDAIGIDLDERNADLALERVGPLLLTVGGEQTFDKTTTV